METTDEPVIEVKSGTLELRGGEYTAGTSVPIKAAAEPNLPLGCLCAGFFDLERGLDYVISGCYL